MVEYRVSLVWNGLHFSLLSILEPIFEQALLRLLNIK